MLNFSDVFRYADLFAMGMANTVLLTLSCGIIGLIIGIIGAELRRSGALWVKMVIGGYVEMIRNTPFIVQLFFLFFGLPSLGIKFNANTAAFIALTLNIAAYFIEIIRAGLEATPPGQAEAARALGLSKMQSFICVLLPPALAKVHAPLVSQFLIVFLGSAVVSQISAEELTFQAQFIQSRTFRAFEVYLIITVLYVFMAFALKAFFEAMRPKLYPWTREQYTTKKQDAAKNNASQLSPSPSRLVTKGG